MDKSGVPDRSRLTTTECEELDVWSGVVGWETDYRQLGRGGFEAWFDMSLCHDLRVVDQYCSREMLATGVPPAGYVPLVLPLNRGARGIFQGKELGQHEAAIVGSGSKGTYRTPPGLRLVTLHLPVERLRKAFQTLADEDLDSLLCETRLIKLSRGTFQRFAWIARQVLDMAPSSGDGVPDVWQRELEEHFVTALIAGWNGRKETGRGRLTRENRVHLVAAARDYIESHLDAPLGLETLARETGVSPRTLEYAFREVFDTTPLRYVKVRRLHAARRRLLDADTTGLTVTDVALDHGFGHLSYFARDYHSLFGELPSETLRA